MKAADFEKLAAFYLFMTIIFAFEDNGIAHSV
jgi:hypothetical protein